MAKRTDRTFVSRSGDKLLAGLDAFGVDVAGCVCADLGCNVGGFTDCLLTGGAKKVYAVDTGYGALAWKLRKDERVAVMERTNALHLTPPAQVDLVTIDVAWTPQKLIIPAAMKWLRPASPGEQMRRPCIISLLKPHYEHQKLSPTRKRAEKLTDAQAGQICLTVCQQLESLGAKVLAVAKSTLRGKGGNVEFLLLIEPGSDCRT